MKTMLNKIIKLGIPEKISKTFNTRFKCEEDRLDYIQDMYLILLELTEEKINKIMKQGTIEDYFSRICINQIINSKSNFHKKYEYNIDKIEITEIKSDDDEVED